MLMEFAFIVLVSALETVLLTIVLFVIYAQTEFYIKKYLAKKGIQPKWGFLEVRIVYQAEILNEKVEGYDLMEVE